MEQQTRPRFDRLKEYWESKGFRSASDFADHLGIGKSHISDIDKKETPAVLLQVLALKTNLNLHWLLTGNGPMEHPAPVAAAEPDSVALKEILAEFHSLSDVDQWRLVAEVKAWLAKLDKNKVNSVLLLLQVAGLVCLGVELLQL